MADNDILSILEEGMQVVSTVVKGVEPGRWNDRSPCEGWTAADVLRHVTGTLRKAKISLAGGAYAAAVAATAVTDADPVAAWEEAVADTRRVAARADVHRIIETPRGQMPVAQALNLPASDLAIHAWDIAAATGQSFELSPRLLAFVKAVCELVPEERMRAIGVFGAPVPAPDGAGPTETLMAWLGRRRETAQLDSSGFL